MGIRLIVSDVDDTLIDHSLTLSPRTRRALDLARQKGVRFTIATGRMFDSTTPFIDILDVHEPVICCQGATTIDPDTRNVTHHLPVGQDIARDILAYTDRIGLYGQYYSLDEYYIQDVCKESEFYRSLCYVAGTPTGRPLHESLDFDPTKLLFIASEEEIRRQHAIFTEKWGDELQIVMSKPIYLEVTHKDAHKGYAVRQLAQYLGIDMQEVMTFGDALNDVTMIQAAGIGVAVGNASQAAKDAADIVAPPQSEDGAAQVIERIILGEG